MKIQQITSITPQLYTDVLELLEQLTNKRSKFSQEELNNLVCSENSILLGAFEDNRLIGMLTLVIVTVPSGKHGRIEDVVVKETKRGKGVGEKLSRVAIKLAAEAKLSKLFLTSNPNRIEANNLYQKIGFKLGKTNSYFYVVDK